MYQIAGGAAVLRDMNAPLPRIFRAAAPETDGPPLSWTQGRPTGFVPPASCL
jgi:hypothetical protein